MELKRILANDLRAATKKQSEYMVRILWLSPVSE